MSNPVPNLDKALEEEGYVRWVQTGTCIGFAKKGLESFVSGRSRVLHQRIKHNVQHTSSYTNMCPNISVSRATYNHTIPGSSNTHNWTMSCFPGCRDCQLYINELVSACSGGFMFSKNHWENSNITNLPVSEWEIAKVYMNPGQDKNIQTAEDTDLSAILNFIEHCSVPYLAISNKQSIQKVRKSKNVIMHSPTFTATPQQLQDFTNSMIDLLTDQTTLLYDQGAQLAVSQIKEAQSSNFTITTDADFRVLRDRALELQKQNKTMQENVKYMQDQCDDLEGKDDEESQTTLAQLVKDIDERERNLQELKSTFSKLEHFASRKRDLQAKMTEHTTITATALFETKEMLTNVKKSYRKLTKQEQDIIDEATDQYETVEEKYDALQKLTEALITENNDKKTENLALGTSKTELELEIRSLKKQLELNQKELESIKLKQGETQAELQTLVSEKKELVADKLERDGKIIELQLQISQLETALLKSQNEGTESV